MTPTQSDSIARTNLMFVDDEPMALDGYRRSLRGADCSWSACFEPSVDAALARLDRERVDVIVTDVTMPGRDGFDLVRSVAAHPGASARPGCRVDRPGRRRHEATRPRRRRVRPDRQAGPAGGPGRPAAQRAADQVVPGRAGGAQRDAGAAGPRADARARRLAGGHPPVPGDGRRVPRQRHGQGTYFASRITPVGWPSNWACRRTTSRRCSGSARCTTSASWACRIASCSRRAR